MLSICGPLTLSLAMASIAQAQSCTFQWTPGFELGAFDGAIAQLLGAPDGLIALGSFDTATGIQNAARWDGQQWHSIGASPSPIGTGGSIIFDPDGPGPVEPQLIVSAETGTPGYIKRWTGSEWEPLGGGTNLWAMAMVIHDADGAGPQAPVLVVGGNFTEAGGVPAERVATWDGESWSAWPVGLAAGVFHLASVDHDGAGPGAPTLYAGTTAAGTGAIVGWSGTGWESVGGGANGVVHRLHAYDADGFGPGGESLVMAGPFTTAGAIPANRIAKWDGSTWSAMGAGLTAAGNASVLALRSIDPDGHGPAGSRLYAVGRFTNSGPVHCPGVAEWTGSGWAQVGPGTEWDVSSPIVAAFVDEDGVGPQPPVLIVGGSFQFVAGEWMSGLARWDGTDWSRVGPAWRQGAFGTTNLVISLASFGAPNEPRSVVAGGYFRVAGGVPVHHVAAWDGQVWSPLGEGLNGSCRRVVEFDPDGPGPLAARLVVSGSFSASGLTQLDGVAQWDGTSWGSLGTGINSGLVHAMTTWDENGAGPGADRLFVGGNFTMAGAQQLAGIASWNGTSWNSLGAGVAGGYVGALAVHDEDGPGPSQPALYAGGTFATAGGVAVGGVARWDGSGWSSLGSGVQGGVEALCSFDPDGNGPAAPGLICGGMLTEAGGLPVSGLAMWSGGAWSALGSGIGGTVRELRAIDLDEAGPMAPILFVGGVFVTAGGIPADNVAIWDGTTWRAITPGPNGGVLSILDVPAGVAGADRSVFLGGGFTEAGGLRSYTIGRLTCDVCYANCDASTAAPVLNVADFTCFLQRFAAGDMYANCDQSTTSPVLNIADFTCFLQRFAAGCP